MKPLLIEGRGEEGCSKTRTWKRREMSMRGTANEEGGKSVRTESEVVHKFAAILEFCG